jgi:penicillin-binding protein 2
MAAALESGAFTPQSEFTCTGRWTGLPGLTFDCWFRQGHGRQDLVTGLTHSCNTVFYEIGKRLDEIDSNFLPSFAARSGLGAVTGVLPAGEAAGLAPTPAWKQQALRDVWVRGDAVNMSIGQGQQLVTPMQLAAVYSAIATSGQGPGPKLLERALLPGGSVERSLPGTSFKLPWSSGTFDAIRTGLRNVVGAPTGTAAFVFQGSPLAGLVSGKTGTAETGGGRVSHAWFACYAPFDAPRAVVLVMLEHGGEGSSAAAPVARRILESVLDRM